MDKSEDEDSIDLGSICFEEGCEAHREGGSRSASLSPYGDDVVRPAEEATEAERVHREEQGAEEEELRRGGGLERSVLAQRAHGGHPPRHASLTVALTRQRNVERFDSPGAYRVPPDRNAAAASSESSVATNQDDSLAPPPPMYSLLEAVPVVSSVLVEATPIEAEIIHNGADEPREPRRRRLLILLFLAALVVASIAVGVAVWFATRNEPATSPGTPSSSAPSLWADSDGSKCASQQETFNLCVNHTGNTSASLACEQCIVDSWPPNPTVCSQIDNETCSALTSARCSSFCLACKSEFLVYFECRSGCALSDIDGCRGLDSGGGTSGIPDYKCYNETVVLHGCDRDDRCERCVAKALSNATFCSKTNEEACVALSSQCSYFCKRCEREFVDYYECKSGCTLAGMEACKPSASQPTAPAATPAPVHSGPTAPTASPPTSITMDEFLSTLPDVTQSEIKSNPASPQARAFAWLTSEGQPSIVGILTQRFSLATLYFATEGEAWLRNDGWLNGTIRECEWFGCTCSTLNDTVQSLKIDDNHLNGTIPPEIGFLTGLDNLGLYSNHLRGTLPTEIGHLTLMLNLFISENKELTGPLPVELASLESMMTLILPNCAFTGAIPTQLGTLTNLVWLALSNNTLQATIPTELGQLTALETLYMEGNLLEGTIPSEIAGLPFLFEVNVENNSLSGRIPADWAAVDFLTYLYLNNNDLTELGSIQFLEELYLQQNEIVGSVPDNLCSMVDDGNLVIRVDCLEITCRCCLCS